MIYLDYYSRINNRTVALLTPGISDYNDEIVAINYSNEQYQRFPLPIRVSYYSNCDLSTLIYELNRHTNLDFYYLKDKRVMMPFYRQIYIDINKCDGSPNMAQNEIYDLMCFNPSKIHVFGMNFILA